MTHEKVCITPANGQTEAPSDLGRAFKTAKGCFPQKVLEILLSVKYNQF